MSELNFGFALLNRLTGRLVLVAIFAALIQSSSTLRADDANQESAQIESNKPKGIVLVLIDDIGYGDINSLSASDLATPNLDNLFQQSLRLTDFHVGTTCSPTRASLLTGRYVNATGVWHTIAGRSILRDDEQTIADVFQANGWRTGVFGKWHLGEGYPFAPRFRGFDTTVIHGGGGVGQQPDYWQNDYYAAKADTKNHAGNPTGNDHYFHNGEAKQADEFCTDYWFSNAFQFIDESLKEDKPFFCYIPTNAAHGPFNAPFGGKAGFDGLIENIDLNMGRLDTYLKAKGIQDDVLVIFTTDNGTAGSERMGGLRGKKGSHYDGGHHVPCFVRWKNGDMAGSPESARDIDSLTAAADVFPTLVDLFDLKIPDGGQPVHGVSLKEMLLDQKHIPKNRSWVVDTQRGANLVQWKRLCVMKDEVKDGKIIHKWRLTRENKDAALELYDWQNDRSQKANLIDDDPDLANKLVSVYESWWKEVDRQSKDYPANVIGADGVEESILYSHDWINKDMSPWHQNHISRGDNGSRVSSIRFETSGKYVVELRRWPREDGGSIDGQDSAGHGEALGITKARLSIEGVGEWASAVESGAPQVAFEIDVEAGEDTILETAFFDQDDQVLSGAYYVYIRKR